MRNAIIFVGVATLLLAACGGEEGTSGQITGDSVTGDLSGGADGEVASPSDDTGNPQETFPEPFTVAFVYKGIVPNENTDKSDLYVVNSDGANPFAPDVQSPVALTSFALDPAACELVLEKTADGTPISTAPCSCNLGCVVDPSLTWIVVTVEKPSATGFGFQIGKFNADHKVQIVKGAKFSNIVDLAFAGGYLYFSQTLTCPGASCQYLVYRYDLENIPEPKSQFLIPPDDDPDWGDGQSITTGHFTASQDGETLAFLNPTIRSTRLYVWRNETLKELDYLCPGGMQDDHCTGSGSEFSDTDPLALSNSGKKLAFFPTTSDGLTMRIYDTDAGTVKVLPLLDSTGKDFLVEGCSQVESSDWRFMTVKDPQFAPDDQGILFVAGSNCDPATRPYSDVVRVPMSTVETGELKMHNFTNLTNNPRLDGLQNTIIETFALSPGGTNIAYIASPIYDGSGNQLSAQSANAKKSREMWVANLNGSQKSQVTYNSKFSATWLLALPLL